MGNNPIEIRFKYNKGRNKTKSKYSFYPTIDLHKIKDIAPIMNILEPPLPDEDY